MRAADSIESKISQLPAKGTGAAASHRFAAPVACALLAAGCFLNTLPNDYCYDDVLIVRDNPRVYASGQWVAIWTSDYWSAAAQESPSKDFLYRPAAISSYRLVRLLAGPQPWPQHLINILLHAAVTAMVVVLAGRLGFRPLVAWLAGAIFAVLPIHNEAVAAITGRADLLAAFGILATLLSHARAISSPAPASAGRWFVIGAVTAFLAMASKESGLAVVPLVVCLHLFTRTWAAPSARSRDSIQAQPGELQKRVNKARLLAGIGIVLIAVVAYLALRFAAFDGQLLYRPRITKTVNVLVDAPTWQHLLGTIQLWGMYWTKTLFPIDLSIAYSINSIRLAASPFHAGVLIGLAAAIGLIGVVVRAWRLRFWPPVFVAVALLISHAPTSNAFALMQVFFAERLWYVPSIWAAMLLGWVAADVWKSRLGRVVVVLALLAYGVRTGIRNAEWRDNGTLFAAAYRDQPEGVQPLNLYGHWLIGSDRIADGVELLRRSVEIDPGYTYAHRALGMALARAGHSREALHHLQMAEMQAPGHEPTVQALARVGASIAEVTAAELEALVEAAARNPDELDAQLSVIRKLRDTGRMNDAMERLAVLDGRFQDHAEWHGEFATTLVLANRLDEAIDRYERAVSIDATNPQRRVELAMLLIERRGGGDIDRADQLTEAAVALAPRTPSVLAGRAEVLALRGEIRAARDSYRQAVDSLPPGSAQRRMYVQRMRALGE